MRRFISLFVLFFSECFIFPFRLHSRFNTFANLIFNSILFSLHFVYVDLISLIWYTFHIFTLDIHNPLFIQEVEFCFFLHFLRSIFRMGRFIFNQHKTHDKFTIRLGSWLTIMDQPLKMNNIESMCENRFELQLHLLSFHACFTFSLWSSTLSSLSLLSHTLRCVCSTVYMKRARALSINDNI